MDFFGSSYVFPWVIMLIWVVLGYLFNRLQRLFFSWNAGREKTPSSTPLIILYFIYLLSPLLFAWFHLSAVVDSLGSDIYFFKSSLRAIILQLLIPWMIGLVALMYYGIVSGQKKTEENRAQESGFQFVVLLAAAFLYGGALALVAFFRSPEDVFSKAAGMMIGVCLVLGFVFLSLAQKGILTVSKGAPIPFDESPLLDELRKISSHFCKPDQDWKIIPLKRRKGDGEINPLEKSHALIQWAQFFNRSKPGLSIVAIQNLSSESILAMVSYLYASRMRPLASRRWYHHKALLWFALFLATFFLTIAFTIFPQLISQSSGSTRWLISALVLCLFIILILLLLWYIKCVLFFGNKYSRSFEIWKQSQPDGVTAMDYLESILEHDRIVMHRFEEEQFLNLVKGNKKLILFLEEHGYSKEDITLDLVFCQEIPEEDDTEK